MTRRDTVINGNPYSMLVPPVRKCMPFCTRTASLLGPVIAVLGEKSQGDALEKLSKALSSVDPQKADALLTDAIQESGLVDGNNQPLTGINFDRYFDDHRADVYQVSLFCLWEIVKDFFPQLGTLGPQALAKAQTTLSKLQSQQDSETITG